MKNRTKSFFIAALRVGVYFGAASGLAALAVKYLADATDRRLINDSVAAGPLTSSPNPTSASGTPATQAFVEGGEGKPNFRTFMSKSPLALRQGRFCSRVGTTPTPPLSPSAPPPVRRGFAAAVGRKPVLL